MLKPHSSGNTPDSKISSNSFVKNGKLISIIHFYISMQIPSGPGDLLACK